MHQAKREIYAQRHSQERQVDPERREMLTRMRKLAMARIEREAKEREELENQRATGVQQQQQQQQQKQQKQQQQEADEEEEEEQESQQQQRQEREQDASAASRYSNGNNSASSSAAQPGLTFRPAPRVSEAAARAPDASNFIVRSDTASDLADRQFSVLADEDHGNSGSTNSPTSQRAPATAVADNLEPEPRKQSKDVVPLIWEKMAETQKEREQECFELQNQAVRGARAASRESEATVVGDIRRNEELNGLD